ncbi:phospholipid carrier-dependent glycosyltransferase [Arcanobacterium haemolyticum]|nr:phospholipid carrier-dependent glycosyltransferase [Arcanobacterium haemolyticum]
MPHHGSPRDDLAPSYTVGTDSSPRPLTPDEDAEPPRTEANDDTVTPTKHASRKLSQAEAEAWEDELRGRLGLLPRGALLPTQIRLHGWIVTAVATIVAALTRLWNLNHPHAVVFDETYYVKGATSLLRQGFEGKWSGDDANPKFLKEDYSALSTVDADYVVHPPFGKWLMAAGQAIFGTDNGLGWRFTTAIAGILAVFLVARIAMRLFRSPWLAAIAAGALAIDGMGIVMSRTGILDNLLSLFVLLGFYTLLRDREHTRARLARRIAFGKVRADGSPAAAGGPELLWRPWLVLTGVLLGLSCGIKWSGIYAVAVFGIVTFVWGVCARRAVGIRSWKLAGFTYDGMFAFYQLVPTAFVAYIGAWLSWFLNPHSYGRSWATNELAKGGEVPLSWAPDTVNSFIHYHEQMWTFHNGLSSPHTYQSQAWEWIFQLRPVSFYWRGSDAMAESCPGEKCVQAITSIGNPVIWWLAVLALIVVVWAAVARRDWRAWSILAGYLGLWVPWLTYTNRTIFQFYAIAFAPYVMLGLAFAIGYFLGFLCPPHTRARAFAEVVSDSRVGVTTNDPAGVPPIGDKPADSHDQADSHEHPDAPATILKPLDEPLPEVSEGASHEEHSGDTSGTAPHDSENPSRLHALLRRFQTYVTSDPGSTNPLWWMPASPDRAGTASIIALAVVIVAISAFWFPLWTGITTSYNFWHIHMWLSSWI